MSDALLARLAEAAGILPNYWDLAGIRRDTTPDTARALLAAMGYPAATSNDLRESLLRIERATWEQILPAATVLRDAARTLAVTLPAALADRPLDWRITCEDGGSFDGAIDLSGTAPIAAEALDGTAFARFPLALPAELPLGYHRLTVGVGPQSAEGTIAVAPAAAYAPDWLERRDRQWGIACHLYSVKSRRNWGIGDFSDLARLLDLAASAGAAGVAVNPLHALFPQEPQAVSPYWPSSRLFLNPLYLDLTAIPAFRSCAPAQRLLRDDAFVARIASANAALNVDYAEVTRIKFDLLRPLAAEFGNDPELARFIAEGGVALQRFAVFSALSEHFGKRPWHQWPEAYRDPDSPQVARWFEAHPRDVRFHVIVQWLAEHQLAAAASQGKAQALGLIRDLAVGISPDGADAWSHQTLFPKDARIGAPPDQFAAAGQDWGIPPPDPAVLKTLGYAPFIAAVRANMRHAGGLRIDHVMALDRLYWIPPGADAASGAYVRYPFEDLIALVALESVRAKCVVVGEDLGTVPEGFRERMERENLLSTRMFPFERHANGLFKRPGLYPERSVASATSHDTPTLAGYWTGVDLRLRGRIDPRFPVETSLVGRAAERALVLAALRDQDLLTAEETPTIESVIAAVHRFLARTRSCLMLVNIADIMGALDQLNMPGTTDTYANWRVKLPLTLEELAASAGWQATLAAIKRER